MGIDSSIGGIFSKKPHLLGVGNVEQPKATTEGVQAPPKKKNSDRIGEILNGSIQPEATAFRS